MIVRDARIEDAVALGALHARTWREAYWGVLPDHMIVRETADGRGRWWRSYLARLMSSPRMRDESVAIAVDPDGAAAGFAWSGPARSADAGPGRGRAARSGPVSASRSTRPVSTAAACG